MTGFISRAFINELISRTNIINLINSYIQLKKYGKNYKTNCPFHNDNNPSFTVNEEKQFFYCFSCGIHGNAIDFLMNYNKTNFLQSIEELASMHNLTIHYDNNVNLQKYNKYQKIYHVMQKLSIFYHNILSQKSSFIANNYLKNRGLNAHIIKYFSIGFAPNEYNSIINKFGASISEQNILSNIGMLIKNNNKTYDMFRKRIMFPIKDHKGRVIAFGGRNLNDDYPKYLNSPENDIFHKHCELYGLYEAKLNNKKISKIIIVEGYIDVITLTQFGINYVVSPLGTSTTIEHIQILFRITNTIICCYDGDSAGKKAAWRTLNISLPYLTDNKQIYFIFLPIGEDPDTTIRTIGKEAFIKLIDNAQPLSIFLFNKLLSKVNIKNIEGKAKLSHLAIPIINKIPGKTLRICLRQQLGKNIGIFDEINLEKLIQKQILNKINKPFIIQNNIFNILLALIIQDPKLADLVPKIPKLKKNNPMEITLFIEIIKLYQNNPNLTSAQILEYYQNNKLFPKLETLATWNHMIMKDMIKNVFIDTLMKVYENILKKRQEELIYQELINKLTKQERQELWLISKTLIQKKIYS